MRISDWSSDVCSSDLTFHEQGAGAVSTCQAYNQGGANKYGVATLTLGSHGTATGEFPTQLPGDEDRGYACSKGGLNSPKYWFCGAHTRFNAGSVTAAQFAQYRNVAYTRPDTTLPVVWAGDVYRTPSDIVGSYPNFYKIGRAHV